MMSYSGFIVRAYGEWLPCLGPCLRITIALRARTGKGRVTPKGPDSEKSCASPLMRGWPDEDSSPKAQRPGFKLVAADAKRASGGNMRRHFT